MLYRETTLDGSRQGRAATTPPESTGPSRSRRTSKLKLEVSVADLTRFLIVTIVVTDGGEQSIFNGGACIVDACEIKGREFQVRLSREKC